MKGGGGVRWRREGEWSCEEGRGQVEKGGEGRTKEEVDRGVWVERTLCHIRLHTKAVTHQRWCLCHC